MQPGVKITQLRIPAPLHEQIQERAYRERKSGNRVMVELLEAGLTAQAKAEAALG